MAKPSESPLSVHPSETTCKYHSYHDFRHRRDHSERSAVLAAMLERPEQYEQRAEALRECGGDAWLWKHKRTGQIKVRTNFCHDRWCPACQRSRRHTLVKKLQHAVEAIGKANTEFGLSLLTVTLRSSRRPLREQMRHLRHAFAVLRRRSFFDDACLGGVVSCEITFNHDTLEWHPHLHVLLIARFIRHATIRQHWAQITRGSTIVDIRRVPAAYVGVRYVSKYMTKPVALLPLPTWFRLELIEAFNGRRLYSVFGKVAAAAVPEKAEREPFVLEDWDQLGSVTLYIKYANAGDLRAREVLGQIGLYTENWQDNPQSEMEFDP